jgi:hypothetical protein
MDAMAALADGEATRKIHFWVSLRPRRFRRLGTMPGATRHGCLRPHRMHLFGRADPDAGEASPVSLVASIGYRLRPERTLTPQAGKRNCR